MPKGKSLTGYPFHFTTREGLTNSTIRTAKDHQNLGSQQQKVLEAEV